MTTPEFTLCQRVLGHLFSTRSADHMAEAIDKRLKLWQVVFNGVPNNSTLGNPTRLLAHTGAASASTACRKRSCNAIGVSTSVRTPVSASTSRLMRTRLVKVVRPSIGSTRRSRSLSPVSSPCNAEPNTRGFLAPFSSTTRRMSARCNCKASDGRIQSIPSESSIVPAFRLAQQTKNPPFAAYSAKLPSRGPSKHCFIDAICRIHNVTQKTPWEVTP